MAPSSVVATPTSITGSNGTNNIPFGTLRSATETQSAPAAARSLGESVVLTTEQAAVRVNTFGSSNASQSKELTQSSTSTTSTGSAPILHQAITGLRVWSGRVRDVDDEVFTAELTPHGHHGPTVLADFDTYLLDADEPVHPGDLFYLKVRTIRERGRRFTRTSNLFLRRLGEWSQEDLDQASSEARDQLRSLEDLIE